MLPQNVLSTETLGGAPLSKQMGEPSFFFFFFFFIIAFNSISLLSQFFSFLFLGQADVRSVPSIASSLESKDFEGGCRSSLLCFLFFLFLFFYFFMPFPCLLLLWRSPCISTFFQPLHLYLLSAVILMFPHPFFNLLYVLS